MLFLSISHNQKYSYLINISGKQRMLSQKVSKIIYRGLETYSLSDSMKNQLQTTISNWDEEFQSIEKLLPNNAFIREEYSKLKEEDFLHMMDAGKNALSAINKQQYLDSVKIIEAHESDFLRKMNKLVYSIDSHASRELRTSVRLLFAISFSQVITIILIILFIFRPTEISLIEEYRQVEKDRDDAIKTEKIKSSFLANMSHEIRTPMNGIIGCTKILEDLNNSAETDKLIKTIKNSAQSLLVIINDILDFSKIESGQLSIEKIPISVKECIDEVVSLISHKAKDNGVTLEVDIDHALPRKIIGDPTRLKQILMNLTYNAIKFSPNGKVIIKCEKKDKHFIKVSIIDNGIGISKEDQSKLFKKFSQIDSSSTRVFGGSGLGLTISKALVEASGGRINVISAKDKGATFYFTLPLQEAGDSSFDRENKLRKHYYQKNLKILVVDDNQVNRFVASGILTNLGHIVEVAEDGVKAIQALEENAFDLVLMDIHMPNLDGIETTKRIKNNSKINPCPVIIALSASVMKEDVKLCMLSGMDDFLGKPIEVSRIEEKFIKYFPKKAS